jgi:hypothetical protein
MCNACGAMVLKRRKSSDPSVKPATGVVGWREYVGLPELGIPVIKAKIDTGARTSALHVEDFRIAGDDNVAFSVPYYYHGRHLVECVATLLGSREIRSTSGSSEERLIIKTAVAIGQRHWHIEVSLADRSNMGFDLILGRTALRRHGLIVDPSRSFLAGEPAYK